MVGVQVHSDGATPVVRYYRHVHHVGGGKHPPTLLVPLETVADGLTESGGPCCFITMLASVTTVLSVAVQRRQHLLVTVVEVDAPDRQVFAMLVRQAVGQPQP